MIFSLSEFESLDRSVRREAEQGQHDHAPGDRPDPAPNVTVEAIDHPLFHFVDDGPHIGVRQVVVFVTHGLLQKNGRAIGAAVSLLARKKKAPRGWWSRGFESHATRLRNGSLLQGRTPALQGLGLGTKSRSALTGDVGRTDVVEDRGSAVRRQDAGVLPTHWLRSS